MKIIKPILSVTVVVFCLMAAAGSILAAPANPPTTGDNLYNKMSRSSTDTGYNGAGLSGGVVEEIVPNIIKGFLSILGLIAVVLIIYAGFLWMTAGGNEEQVSKAKKLITNAVIGLIIIMAAYSIAYFVISRLSAASKGAECLNPPC